MLPSDSHALFCPVSIHADNLTRNPDMHASNCAQKILHFAQFKGAKDMPDIF